MVAKQEIIVNVMKWIFIFAIRLYQKFISPCLPPACRFIPSCSQYFIEALQKKGILKGSILGIYRILRCNPWCKGGYDPVTLDHLSNNSKKSK